MRQCKKIISAGHKPEPEDSSTSFTDDSERPALRTRKEYISEDVKLQMSILPKQLAPSYYHIQVCMQSYFFPEYQLQGFPKSILQITSLMGFFKKFLDEECQC